VSDPFPPPVHRSFAQRLRSWFFTGLIVFGPIAVTAYIAWWVIDTIDNWVRPWLPSILSPDIYLPRSMFLGSASSSRSSGSLCSGS
jgi:uncharacterized membrane protein